MFSCVCKFTIICVRVAGKEGERERKEEGQGMSEQEGLKEREEP